ncbi:MORN variant repeat protein [Chthoniobacter flavus Ellin428]|uniref:MORN variant repeat protein n=2 Tax=Chthoniobacter flavus TaxID=191863 RepID=B4DC47_9BACT|nr:toxin-antitoxin system YwqK family antitoxin [Chthoniobacter flavus]EDY15969.1 MORN variant repeat protein [Chthoniobacter flavus Ellin428]TCO83283.1 MORN repeat protein [Chthoniobacter flavus]
MSVLRWPVILLCALLSGVAARAQETSYLDYSIPANARKVGPDFLPPNLTEAVYLLPGTKVDPFTRYIEPELVGRERFDNGVLVSREMFLNEKKHGVQREWYPNGQLKSEEPYRNGVMHGVFKTWSEKGALTGQATFVEGTGKLQVYDEDGVLIEETNYKGSRENGLFFSRLHNPRIPDHRMTFMWVKDGVREGWAYDFYEDGTLSSMNFAMGSSGNVYGPNIDFDKNGAIASVKWYGGELEIPEAVYAKAAALRPEMPPYYHDPDKYKEEFVTPEVRALVKDYQEMPRVKIPLEFGPDGKPILARQP